MVSEAYGAATTLNASTPSTGNATIGTRAVAGRAMASVIHHAAISAATAATTGIASTCSFLPLAAARAMSPAFAGKIL